MFVGVVEEGDSLECAHSGGCMFQKLCKTAVHILNRGLMWASWGLLGGSWAGLLGGSWGHLGPSWGVLGRRGGDLGAFRRGQKGITVVFVSFGDLPPTRPCPGPTESITDAL